VLVNVANPVVLTGAVPRVVLPVENVTFPEGCAVVTLELTVADSVMLVPGGTGVVLEAVAVKAVVVEASATLTVRAVALLAAKLELPL
jgi:hypothetical protein